MPVEIDGKLGSVDFLISQRIAKFSFNCETDGSSSSLTSKLELFTDGLTAKPPVLASSNILEESVLYS
ncbi:MAG: hypothetical protein ACXVC3_08045 [Bdellovibrio sp.]